MALQFNQYANEGTAFLRDYSQEMELSTDMDRAGRILTATLHALRDIIPMEESLQFMAQLPMFLKAVYVNGWSLKKKGPKIKHLPEFIDLVREYDGSMAAYDFDYSNEMAEAYISTTFIYLSKYVSMGELLDIRDTLPKELKPLIPSKLIF
ncbi:Uncharacterized conserved protein, DUF2267 family [Arenibacter nanhaiticus]|uniref:Uncharacterized conserved protein, DUF2267 family n=1 Tax=Arenibacter nanhaiticus TaxID=558155 RepID=A0A1M6DXM4_9FLAO|nr:DUF2267 domain-containing protein [Arenibacter nanhaiticus]SHI77768.1 Uncharacterized conserved protein, DUF2267 family [Arenibacter nanhaiticus]